MIKDKIWTIPNVLSTCRLALAPGVSYMIISQNHPMALALFMTAAITDAADGFIARRYPSQRSILGSIIDPLADKVLMTSVTCAFAYSGVLPMPLATLIVGRDVGLTIGTGYVRYQSLPAPKTMSRMFDVTLPSAEVKPPFISKVILNAAHFLKINTLLQVSLMTSYLTAPVFDFPTDTLIEPLQYSVALTTVGSAFHYWKYKNIKILTK